ncbi:tectonin domain-containing protein [Streptomyces sp. NPDC002285]
MRLGGWSWRRGGRGRIWFRSVLAAIVALATAAPIAVVSASPAAATEYFPHGSLAAARNQDGRLEMFGVDGNHNMWHRRQNSAGSVEWASWTPFGGSFTAVAAEINTDGLVEVFGVKNGQISYRKQTAPNSEMWSDWTLMADTSYVTSVAVARNADGRLELFAVNANFQIFRRREATPGSEQWTSWEGPVGSNTRTLAAEANKDGRIELFVTDTSDQIWHTWQSVPNANDWTVWSQVPGSLHSIALAPNADGSLQAMGTNALGTVYYKRQVSPGSSWTEWTSAGGSQWEAVAAELTNGRIELFTTYIGGTIYRITQPQPNGSLSDWNAVPGEGLSGATPPSPTVYNIMSADTMVQRQTKFVYGILTPNAIINIDADVEIDLSYLSDLLISRGVQILGKRSQEFPRGPLLYTTTTPYNLFLIGNDFDNTTADNVKIKGIRLAGGLRDPADAVGTPGSHGIRVSSSRNVEIADSEIFGWSGAGITVSDSQNRINQSGAWTVLIRNNAIYDNQHPSDGTHGAGYGVVVGFGAYAWIDSNVFNRNSHQIAASGTPGDGYVAYRNLVMAPGLSRVDPEETGHHFDVHASGSCDGGHYNCGLAGEFFDIRWNTFLDRNEIAVKLRGTPSQGMMVTYNEFARSKSGSLMQLETGMTERNNEFNADHFGDLNQRFDCDFDGDGTDDKWTTSGNTMWYLSSSRTTPTMPRWMYLMQTTKLAADINATDLAGYIASGVCS